MKDDDESHPPFSGGDGSSFEKAVVIHAESTDVGLSAEYGYISSLFGRMDAEWSAVQQRLVKQAGKHYDVVVIRLNNGTEKSIYFDITHFFGKL